MEDKLDKFFDEAREALFADAYEWVDEHCRKKLKKFPTDIRLYAYLCIGAYRNRQYIRAINKALNALAIAESEDIYTITLKSLINLSLKKLTESNADVHESIKQKANEHLKGIDNLILDNIDKIKALIKEDPDLFGNIFEEIPQIKSNAEDKKELGLNYLLEDGLESAAEHFSSFFGPKQSDATVKAAMAFIFRNYEESIRLCDEALISGKNSKITALKAKSMYELERFDEAFKYFKESIDSGLNKKELLFYAANCLIELDRKKESIEYIDKALEIDPKDIDLLTNKGAALLKLKKHKEALNCFNKALELNPSDETLLTLLANKGIALKNIGLYDEAIDCFNKYAELTKDADILLGFGEELSFEGDFKRAKKCYSMVIEKEENEFALLGIANCLIELDDNEKAIEYYNGAIDLSKDEGVLESALLGLKIIKASVDECINKLLTINPDNKIALKEKAIILEKNNKYAQALNYFDRVGEIELEDADYEFLASKAICLEKLGKFEDGKKYYEKAIKINRGKEALNGLNRCKRALRYKENLDKKRQSITLLEPAKDYAKIIDVCSIILKEAPNDAFCLEKKANSLLKINKKNEAFECYDQLIELTNNEELLVKIMDIYKKFEIDISKCCSKLLQINPNNEQANKEKGIYLTKAKKYNEAMDCFANVKTDIGDKEYLSCRAISSQLTKNYSGAADYYQRLFNKDVNMDIENKKLLFNYFYTLIKIRDFYPAKDALKRLLQLLPLTSIFNFIDEITKEEEKKQIRCFILKHLALNAELEKDYDKSIKYYNEALSYIHDNSTIKRIKGMLDKNESYITINAKSKISFYDFKELIICDSNILVFKVFYDLKGILNILGDDRCEKAFDKFRKISGNNHICLTGTVMRQISMVWPSLFDAYSCEMSKDDKEKIKEQIKNRINKYERYYDIKKIAEVPLLIKEHEFKKIEYFYRKFPDRLKAITERKIRGLNEADKLKKLWARNDGKLPERSDMYILTQAVKLNSLCINGINRVAIFSDDNDFCEFSNEIEEEFNVKIYPL